MVGAVTSLPAVRPVTHSIRLGVIAKFLPLEKVREVLAKPREPAFTSGICRPMLSRTTLLRWRGTGDPPPGVCWRVSNGCSPSWSASRWPAGRKSRRRAPVGAESLCRIYAGMVGPIAGKNTKESRCRDWRLVSLDGSSLHVADTKENEPAFGRPRASCRENASPRPRSWPYLRTEHMCCRTRTRASLQPAKSATAHGVELSSPNCSGSRSHYASGKRPSSRRPLSPPNRLVRRSRVLAPLQRVKRSWAICLLAPLHRHREARGRRLPPCGRRSSIHGASCPKTAGWRARDGSS